MTDEALEEFRDVVGVQGEELREATAEYLDGVPEEYRTAPVADDGE